jgi:hypothetical protein
MHRELRAIIREMIQEIEEEESLDEFSGVAALGGGPATPLGTDAHYPDSKVGGKKKIKEANTVYSAGSATISGDYDGDGKPDSTTGKVSRTREQMYYDSVERLARSFGGAETPFDSHHHVKKHLTPRY